MNERQEIVHTDPRGRIALARFKPEKHYLMTVKDNGTIILEPAVISRRDDTLPPPLFDTDEENPA